MAIDGTWSGGASPWSPPADTARAIPAARLPDGSRARPPSAAPSFSLFRTGRVLAGAALLAVVTIVGWAIRDAGVPLDGPVPVAWDRQPCAHCAMHLGEPGFAVQAHTADGTVLFFDDPGCYFAYRHANALATHVVWFHHVREDRWLRDSAVAFTPVGESPMGWNLGAVDAGTPGALTLEAAQALVSADRAGDGSDHVARR